MFGKNFEQTGTGIEAVVKTEPAFLEENVAAHLAGQWRAGFRQLGLDQGVAGLPHQRGAPAGANGARYVATAFHVKNDGGARNTFQYILSAQNELAVRPDDL